jgi:hypothetical protein
MSSRPELKIDWCSHAAAKYAVEHWHYSKSLPMGKQVLVGAWEAGAFIGCVAFGRGANRNMAGQYGLTTTECVELTRIALKKEHATPVSRIGAIALRFLRSQSPGIRLIISYADPAQNHHGGIYQAMGWLYVGTSQPQSAVCGMHKRTATSRYGSTKGLPRTAVAWKHKYLMPLDDEMRRQIEPLRKPYPKRVRSADSGTSGNQPESGGARSESVV